MRTLLLFVAMVAVSESQSGTGSIAGVWTAQFDGRTFVRLELTTGNGTITGGMSLGNFEVDAQGVVRSASQSPRELTPIFDVGVRASTLTFSRRDGAGTDRFELRVLDAGRADMQILLDDEDREELAASGIPIPKPIRLTKQ